MKNIALPLLLNHSDLAWDVNISNLIAVHSEI